MQELKFRGMTRKKGEKVYLDGTPVEGNWVYGGVMQGKGDFSVIYENETYDKKVVYTDTLCQYTGLKDKNETEIYEGDIVEFLDVDMVGQVVYENGCFGIGFKDYIDWNFIEECIEEITGYNNILRACLNDNFISLWEIMWNYNDEENSIYTVKVIGNIFDNPELLERGVE